jgi:hypothetical protein
MKLRAFNLSPYINKIFSVAVFIIFILIFASCKKENYLANAYKSDFTNKEISTLTELEYWTKSSNEWQVENNRIECLVSKEFRKIYLLTRQLSTDEGNAEIKVRLGFFNDEISNLSKNWAGVNIGSQGKLDEIESTRNQKGINIGVCTNGVLFIGSPSPNKKNINIINALKNGVDLKILIKNNSDTYTIDFSVLEINTGKVLGRISKKNIVLQQITGNFGLISNFENSENKTIKDAKSVWFQNWEIKGSKVEILEIK